MITRTLGRSDLKITPVIMGCWAIAGGLDWGDQDEQQAINAINASLDAGVTTFDTAEAYGNGASETLLGKALAGKREQVQLLSKVNNSNLDERSMFEHCDASLKRLGTDYLDLYQVHWPNHDKPIAPVLENLDKLKQQGKIRAAGVSNFGPEDMADLLEHGRVESNQMVYSLLTRGLEYEVLPQCLEHGVGILAYSPLAQGLLTGKFESVDDVPEGRRRTRHFSTDHAHAKHGEEGCEKETFDAIRNVQAICDEIGRPMNQVALAWAIAQRGVTGVIAGARNAEQARDNAAAGRLDLSDDTLAALSRATEPVKKALGETLDVWSNPPRIR